MIQDIYPAVYDLTYSLKAIEADDKVILIRKNTVHLKNDDLPSYKEIQKQEGEEFIYLFRIGETSYYTSLNDHPELEYEVIRKTFNHTDNLTAFAVSTGAHLHTWYANNIYCGSCGHKLVRYDRERALYCEECGRIVYPNIAPAVIIGLINDDRILVSRYANRDYKGTALLAGFCEIGETPEETCRREVMEEVGLKIRDIRYFGSQPWGIDSNLLLGYFVRLDGDDRIRLDENELANAEWVSREELEKNDQLKSLTATMIEAFRTNRIQ